MEKEIAQKTSIKVATEGLRARFAFEDNLEFTDASGDRHEVKAAEGISYAEGRPGRALDLKKQFIDAGKAISFDRTNSFSCGGWIFYRGNQGAILSRMSDEENYRGF